MRLKSLIEVASITFIVVVAAGIAAALVWRTFIHIEPVLLEGFIGAFMGAFFAFLFIRLGDTLTRFYERMAQDRTALVTLQHYFNDCLGIIGDDLYICDVYFAYYDELHSGEPRVSVFANDFHPIPIRRELLLSLLNLDFINELSTFTVHVRKLNDSMATLNKMIGQANDALISQNINREIFIENSTRFRESVFNVKQFLNAAKDEVTELFAATRVMTQRESTFSKITRHLTKARYSAREKEAIPAAIQKLKEELDQSSIQSGKRIDRVQSNNKTAQT